MVKVYSLCWYVGYWLSYITEILMGSISLGIAYQLGDYIPNKDAAGMLRDLHIKSNFQRESIDNLFCRKVLLLVGYFVLLASTLHNHHGQ
jgi:hypothetical protein